MTMKTVTLISILSLWATNEGFASATLVLEAQNVRGELQAVHNQTKAGFIGHGGEYSWKVKYFPDPGAHTLTGKSPGCPPVVQTASFKEGQSYKFVMTDDCRIESFAF
jgi:hypothetical protein